MDLSKTHNPYDFANPVSDEKIFTGRSEELKEIRYYLDQAKSAPRPINIALLGARASGKTSVLNMCEIEAKKRNFCTIRIDLDENDAETQLCFFYKLFDGIFSGACDCGAFGGKNGKTYDNYLDIVSTYNIPTDKTFCPFIFPLQYARAMSTGNYNLLMSDFNYRSDLKIIRKELNTPIVILFDECNVLSKSRVHLEKIRNIFMNTIGYMLVFTGTPDLFPVMDEVFSPIIRQFKKILISEFKNESETGDCMKKPLESIGIDPKEVIDLETLKEVAEIHDLSGGRPYEIQLICHVMFRRLQEKKTQKLKLDYSVLEDVRKELETSQDITHRPILTKIINYNKDDLLALSRICLYDGNANSDEVWTLEYMLNGQKFWTKESLYKAINKFLQDGIVTIKEDKSLNFCGDDFDKIYTKYYAREQRINFSFIPTFSIGDHWEFELDEIMRGNRIPFFSDQAYNAFWKEIMEGDDDVSDCIEDMSLIKDMLSLSIKYRNQDNIPSVNICLKLPLLSIESFYMPDVDTNHDDDLDRNIKKLHVYIRRAKKLGGEFYVEKKTLKVYPTEGIINKIAQTKDEGCRDYFISYHSDEIIEAYKNKNVLISIIHVDSILRYNIKPEDLPPGTTNNIGYILMFKKDYNHAKKYFYASIKNNDESNSSLPMYNAAIAEAMIGNYNQSIKLLSDCINRINEYKYEDNLLCLYIPKHAGNNLICEEIWEPNLQETAIKSKHIIESFNK